MNDDLPSTMMNVEAEQAVIGGLLVAPSEIAAVAGILSKGDFYRPAHAVIYDAIRTTIERADGRVDQLAVMETLRVQGDLMRIGGAPYLHTCISAIPTSVQVPYWASLVVECSRRRQLLQAAQRLVQAAQQPDGDMAREVVADMLIQVESIIDSTSNDQPLDVVEFGDFVEQTRNLPREFIIPGLLCPMDRVVIVAGEGAGKSWWSRQMAVALGQGVHPLRTSLRIPARRTLMVDLENPPGLIAEHGKRFIASAHTSTGKWQSENVYLWSRPDGIDLRKTSDVALLDRVMAHVRPSLMCLGPLYKAAMSGSDRGEQVAQEVSHSLDKLRVKHRCALWLETHAPMEQQNGRLMRPLDSGLWTRWPEFGRTMLADPEDRTGKTWTVGKFRYDRDVRIWPDYMTRGTGDWPWEAHWNDGPPFDQLEDAA